MVRLENNGASVVSEDIVKRNQEKAQIAGHRFVIKKVEKYANMVADGDPIGGSNVLGEALLSYVDQHSVAFWSIPGGSAQFAREISAFASWELMRLAVARRSRPMAHEAAKVLTIGYDKTQSLLDRKIDGDYLYKLQDNVRAGRAETWEFGKFIINPPLKPKEL